MFSLFGVKSDDKDIRAVLDIGTSKAVCLIGCEEPGLGVRIIGSGQAPIEGVKYGAVVDLERAQKGIREAVRRAEKKSGVAVRSVSVNVSSRSLSSHRMEVETAFANGAVAERDLKRLKQESLSKEARPETVILHALPMDWRVDQERGIKDPTGMYGSRLSVYMHFVKADIGPLRNLAHCIERSHIQIGAARAAPLAAAEAVLTDDEKDLGATVIDLGAGVTSFAIYRHNQLLHAGTIGRGGDNITHDLAIGLSTLRKPLSVLSESTDRRFTVLMINSLCHARLSARGINWLITRKRLLLKLFARSSMLLWQKSARSWKVRG